MKVTTVLQKEACQIETHIHIEVKRVEHLNIDDALDQARRDAGKTTGNLPTVFHRKNNTGWKVTMDAADWFKLYREWEGGGKP